MMDQKLGTFKAIRFLQLIFLSSALWFIYWAHIYEMTYWNKILLESFQSNISNVLIYSVLIVAVIYLEFRSKTPHHTSFPSSSVTSLEKLKKENEQMKYKLQRSKKIAF